MFFNGYGSLNDHLGHEDLLNLDLLFILLKFSLSLSLDPFGFQFELLFRLPFSLFLCFFSFLLLLFNILFSLLLLLLDFLDLIYFFFFQFFFGLLVLFGFEYSLHQCLSLFVFLLAFLVCTFLGASTQGLQCQIAGQTNYISRNDDWSDVQLVIGLDCTPHRSLHFTWH